MLIRVTNRCTMGCSHCMIPATPDGEHMTMDTFSKAIFWLQELFPDLPGVIMLSGGEPSEHPSLVQMIDLVKAVGYEAMVLTNGEFLHTDSKRRDLVLERATWVQVTNDPAYYPRHVETYEHPKVLTERKLRVLSPFGRALTSKPPFSRLSPTCFNLRSLTRHLKSFDGAVFALRSMGKFCQPSINVDGSIVAGEAPSCTKIGQIGDSNVALTTSVSNMTCSRCGLVSNINQAQRRAIGESSLFSGDE